MFEYKFNMFCLFLSFQYSPDICQQSPAAQSVPPSVGQQLPVTVQHPAVYDELQSVMRRHLHREQSLYQHFNTAVLPPPTATLPPLPASVRASLLQLRLDQTSGHTDTLSELRHFFKSQLELIEANRLSHLALTPTILQLINSYFDTQLHILLDKIEQSLCILDQVTTDQTLPLLPSDVEMPVVPSIKTSAKSLVKPKKLKPAPFQPKVIRVMQKWYNQHCEHPYPSYETAEVMAETGNISVEQVKRWFANRRVRDGNTKHLSVIALRRRSTNDISNFSIVTMDSSIISNMASVLSMASDLRE